MAKIVKLLCVFFATLTVLLCGCGGGEKEKPELCADFKANFSADFKGLTVEGSLNTTRQGVCVIDVSSPETLGGLQVRYKSGEVALSRGAVQATADEGYLPESGLPQVLRELFTSIAAKDYSAGEDGAFTLSLSCGDCKLTADSELLPQTAEIPGCCTVQFSDCEKIGE